MLTKEMYKQLNSQINLEFYSSNLYLQMSSWFFKNGYEGCGEFMRQHADEERQHMTRLFDYVIETGEYAVIAEIEDIGAFYISMINKEGELVIYPNNLLLQKGISIINLESKSDSEFTD